MIVSTFEVHKRRQLQGGFVTGYPRCTPCLFLQKQGRITGPVIFAETAPDCVSAHRHRRFSEVFAPTPLQIPGSALCFTCRISRKFAAFGLWDTWRKLTTKSGEKRQINIYARGGSGGFSYSFALKSTAYWKKSFMTQVPSFFFLIIF